MIRTLILGAGGHAQVVADILLSMQAANIDITPVGYLDDNPDLHGQRFLDVPVLGSLAEVSGIAHDAVIISIGDLKTRRRLYESLQSQGEHFAVARHPSALISPDVQVGPGTIICPGVIISPDSTIGANVIMSIGCTVSHHIHIGDHVHLAQGVCVWGGSSVGESTLIGSAATVMLGRHVGAGCVVGAGALVTKDIPDGVTVTGVPAKIVKR